MKTLLILLASIIVAGIAQAACPTTQPSSIVAVGGKLSICSTEAISSVEIEKDGTVLPTIAGPFAAGVQANLSSFAACANTSLRARGVNAAGAGAWSANVASTFPPCSVPKLLEPLP
jgi:hypothetical protein